MRWTVLFSCLLLAPVAEAQLSDFDWTLMGSSDGSGTVNATLMHVVGPANESGCVDGDSKWFETVATTPGHVTAHFDWQNLDFCIGWWLVEMPFHLVGGVKTFIGNGVPGFEYDSFEKDVAFDVDSGTVFGFGVRSTDCLCGPGVLDVTSFVFEPAFWPNLGAGLAGGGGVPKLAGLGLLTGGSNTTVSLVEAAPNAPAYLVVGASALQAPFKGGVLVPAPDLVLGLVTSPFGRIVLNASWPSSMPSGLALYFQYWIQDAAAPQGYSASNGLAPILP